MFRKVIFNYIKINKVQDSFFKIPRTFKQDLLGGVANKFYDLPGTGYAFRPNAIKQESDDTVRFHGLCISINTAGPDYSGESKNYPLKYLLDKPRALILEGRLQCTSQS